MDETITYEEFEKQVRDMVETYGGFEEEINKFLFESNYLEYIIELSKIVQ